MATDDKRFTSSIEKLESSLYGDGKINLNKVKQDIPNVLLLIAGKVQDSDSSAYLFQLKRKCKELGLEDPVAEVKNLQEQVKASETDRIANKLTAEFGPEKSKDGKDNLLRAYVAKQITNAKDLDAQIEAVKKDPVAMQLAGQAADFASNANRIGIVEQADGQEAPDPNAPIVADY